MGTFEIVVIVLVCYFLGMIAGVSIAPDIMRIIRKEK